MVQVVFRDNILEILHAADNDTLVESAVVVVLLYAGPVAFDHVGAQPSYPRKPVHEVVPPSRTGMMDSLECMAYEMPLAGQGDKPIVLGTLRENQMHHAAVALLVSMQEEKAEAAAVHEVVVDQ